MAGTLGEGGGRLVDHPTDPLTNSKGWGGVGGDASSAHLTVEKSYRIQSDRVTKAETWTGPYEELLDKARGLPIGWDDGVAPELAEMGKGRLQPMDEPFVSANSMSRAAGNIWTLNLEYTQLFAVSQWSVSFNAIEKDIHTWMSDADDENARPDIALVRAWEALEPQSEGYRNFTVNGEPLTGNTLELAQMIARGVSSYTLYQPVMACTYATRHAISVGECLNHVYEGDGAVVDAIDKLTTGARATSMMQGQPMNGADLTMMFPTDVATPKSNKNPIIWVNSSDRLQHNPDGTFTRSMEFTGVTSVDRNLYYSDQQGGGDDE